MSLGSVVSQTLTVAFCCLAVVVLYYARGRLLLILSGWILLAGALFARPSSGDPVASAFVVLFAFAAIGMLVVFACAERHPARLRSPRPTNRQSGSSWRWQSYLRGAVALLLPMIAAMGIAAVAVRLPIGRPGDRVAIVSTLVPFLWAGFLLWLIADPRLRRPAIAIASSMTIAAGAFGVSLLL